MENKLELLTLIDKKQQLENELKNLVYGSVEVREKQNDKYIYVHYRDEGIRQTRYVGEYSKELMGLVLSNNIKAKEIKKELRQITKQLKAVGYTENIISEDVARNIDFARKQLVSTIFDQAILEGVDTTYLDTETIIEGGKVSNMTVNDILKVVNLKHAWEFILNAGVISSPTNFALLSEINKFVEEGFYYTAGKIRSTPVSIGGTNWKPDLPIESQIKEQLADILNSNLTDTDKAIELLLFVMKKQIFIDGNKRTAVIFANHYLISHAKGIIVIPNEKVEEYKKLLISYYEIDNQDIKEFLRKYALHLL